MLQEMLLEVDRLIAKYNSPEWDTKPTAIRLVEILVDHRNSVQNELNEVISGVRKLRDTDFLGPKERAKRRLVKAPDERRPTPSKKDNSRYFVALEQKRFDNKRRVARHAPKRQGEAHEYINAGGDVMISDREFMGLLSNGLK